VVKFLHSEGIPNDRLVAAGYGEHQPLSSTDPARNRRIELKLTNR
jgi:chemotaxis protein MotB